MAVVKAVSFQPEVLDYGQKVANELFGKNLSIFITFLICSYRKNKIEINLKEDEELGEELKECIKNMMEVFREVKF